jgi:hypothetical protein
VGPLTFPLALGPLTSPALVPAVVHWPPLPTLTRLALALGVGLFVGLEREWRGHEAGLRTFGFAALLGGLGGLLGEAYALLSLGLLGLLVGFLIWQSVRAEAGTELTTSAALLVTGFAGVLCGQGHTFTPVAVATLSAALLAWKERLAGFSLGLTAAELRSAILLGLLAFVVYPALPEAPLDPWGLVAPRAAWATVVLLAGISFANYILWKRYGSAGVVVTGFLGGLVNSTVVVTELATRVRASRSAEAGDAAGAGGVADGAYRGVLLATAAMLARNAVLLGLLAAGVLVAVAGPLAAMLAASAGLAFAGGGLVAGTWSPGRARRPAPAARPGGPPRPRRPAGGRAPGGRRDRHAPGVALLPARRAQVRRPLPGSPGGGRTRPGGPGAGRLLRRVRRRGAGVQRQRGRLGGGPGRQGRAPPRRRGDRRRAGLARQRRGQRGAGRPLRGRPAPHPPPGPRPLDRRAGGPPGRRGAVRPLARRARRGARRRRLVSGGPAGRRADRRSTADRGVEAM